VLAKVRRAYADAGWEPPTVYDPKPSRGASRTS
jgi:hypothetical protein